MKGSCTRGSTSQGNCANGARYTNPRDLLGARMQGWWDAADFNTSFTTISGNVRAIDTLVFFQAVGRWQDKSGNGHHLLALADDSTRGVLSWDGAATGFPGSNKPQIAFIGANSRVMQATFPLTQPCELFVVGKTVTADGLAGNAFIDGASGGSTMRVYVDVGSPTKLMAYAGAFLPSNEVRVDSPTVFNTAGRTQFRILYNAGSSLFRYNNGVEIGGPIGAGVPNGITLGRFGGAAIFSSIAFNEIILTNAACTAAERAVIEQYFRVKWGCA